MATPASAPARASASGASSPPTSGSTSAPGATLDDEVVLIDFDHGIADSERPIRLQSLVTAPVVIGERAILAAGATVLRGVVVGAGARVQPRGLVTRDVAPGATVGGVPARPVRG